MEVLRNPDGAAPSFSYAAMLHEYVYCIMARDVRHNRQSLQHLAALQIYRKSRCLQPVCHDVRGVAGDR